MINTTKCGIVFSLALVTLVMSPANFAADNSGNNNKVNTDWLKSRFADESPENIKLRSAPGNPVAGKDKSLLCQGCHGEKGRSSESMIPHLAGQYGTYISKNLRNYQAGTRTNQIMSAMAATISDDDLADISAYFASMPKMAGDGSAENKSSAQAGKKLYLAGDMSRMVIACTNCHGPGGKGRAPNISMFPVIGGQQAGYLKGQLIDWRNGARTNSANAIMNTLTKKLTDSEIDSLAEYMSSL